MSAVLAIGQALGGLHRTLWRLRPGDAATTIESGGADILTAADATTLPLLEDPNIGLVEAKGALLMSMVMMVDQKPYNDVRVRQALKLVVDRAGGPAGDLRLRHSRQPR